MASEEASSASAPPQVVTRQMLRGAPVPGAAEVGDRCSREAAGPARSRPSAPLDSCGRRGSVPGALPRSSCRSAGRVACGDSSGPCSLRRGRTRPASARLSHCRPSFFTPSFQEPVGAPRGAGPVLGLGIPSVPVARPGSLLHPARRPPRIAPSSPRQREPSPRLGAHPDARLTLTD